MRASARFGKGRANVNGLDLVAEQLLVLMGHSVGDHETAEAAIVEVLDCLSGENAVRDDCDNFARAVLHDRLSGLDERPAGVCHVVDDNGNLILDVADEDHPGHLIRTRTLLVDQSELKVKAVGNGSGSGSKVSICETREIYGTGRTNLLAPPASGLTMTHLLTSRFSRIHFSMLGSA